MPPPAFVFTESPVAERVAGRLPRVIPFVALPLGSFVASANAMFGSAARLVHGVGDLAAIGVGPPIVRVEHVDLALDLLVGDVLLVGLVDDVHDALDRHQLAPHPLASPFSIARRHSSSMR